MASFITDFFNKTTDADRMRLTNEMTQAFYRREYDTIDMLAQQGARFNKEMLCAAMRLKDPQLALLCMRAGVTLSRDDVDPSAPAGEISRELAWLDLIRARERVERMDDNTVSDAGYIHHG